MWTLYIFSIIIGVVLIAVLYVLSTRSTPRSTNISESSKSANSQEFTRYSQTRPYVCHHADDASEPANSSNNRNMPEQEQTRTYIYAFTYQQHDNWTPRPISIETLDMMSVHIRDSLYNANTDRCVQTDERNYDTVAVAVNDKNDKLIVAANIKERKANMESKTDITYGEFGMKDEDVRVIKNSLASLNYDGYFTTEIITTRETPQTPQRNAEAHAEMQILSYAREKNVTISRIGISKPPCKNCKENLENSNVENGHAQDGNQKPKNFKDPRTIDTKRLGSVKNSTFKWVLQENLPRNADELLEASKKSIKLRMSFNCTVSSATLLDMYDNYDREASVKSEICFFNRGSYRSDKTCRRGVYVNTGVYQGRASVSVIDATVSVLSASANAQVSMAGVSAGFNFTLASVELSAGPVSLSFGLKASSGISVGVDGIEVQFLGTGLTCGPRKIRIHTPVVDLQVNPNAVVAALLVVISNAPKSDFHVDNDVFESFKFAIVQFFSGRPPPPPPPPAAAALTIEKPQQSSSIRFVPIQGTTPTVRRQEWLAIEWPTFEWPTIEWPRFHFNIFKINSERGQLTH